MPHSSSNAIAGANEKHEHVYTVASSTDGSFSYAVCFKKNVAFFFGYLARRSWKREEPSERNVSLKCVVTSTYFTRRKNRLNALCLRYTNVTMQTCLSEDSCYLDISFSRWRWRSIKFLILSWYHSWYPRKENYLVNVLDAVMLWFIKIWEGEWNKRETNEHQHMLRSKRQSDRWLKRDRETIRSRWALVVSYLARAKAIEYSLQSSQGPRLARTNPWPSIRNSNHVAIAKPNEKSKHPSAARDGNADAGHVVSKITVCERAKRKGSHVGGGSRTASRNMLSLTDASGQSVISQHVRERGREKERDGLQRC